MVMEEFERLRVMSKHSKLGKFARPVCSDSSWHPLSSKVRKLLSSRYRQDSSHMRVLRSVLGKRVGVKSECPCFCCLLQLLQLKIFNMPRHHILE